MTKKIERPSLSQLTWNVFGIFSFFHILIHWCYRFDSNNRNCEFTAFLFVPTVAWNTHTPLWQIILEIHLQCSTPFYLSHWWFLRISQILRQLHLHLSNIFIGHWRSEDYSATNDVIYRSKVSWQSRLKTRSSMLETIENRESRIEDLDASRTFRGSRAHFGGTIIYYCLL